VTFQKTQFCRRLYLDICFFINSFFWLAGTPGTAALFGGKNNYLPASMFCGVVVIPGATLVFCGRLLRLKSHLYGTGIRVQVISTILRTCIHRPSDQNQVESSTKRAKRPNLLTEQAGNASISATAQGTLMLSSD
jgi:hypothetical protein